MKKESKKLVTVLATSTPVTVAKEEEVSEHLEANLARVPCIHFPINFGKKPVSALLDSGSEVNAVYLAFAKKLHLPIRPTDVEPQKNDGITLETFKMVVGAFSVKDKANRVRLFEEIFLVANISQEILLGMPFLTLSSADVDFLGRELRWRTYSTKEALPTTRRVKLVGKKEFTAAALDLEHETYIVHVGLVSSDTSPSSSPSKINIHPSRRPWVSGLIAEEAPTKVLAKYSDFADVFSSDLTSELPKHTGFNNHVIELVNG